MSEVFISYSRKDKAFVRKLHDALVGAKRDTWVDWEDIPPTADWFAEIKGAIQAADTFIFVLSPDSIASKVCGDELAHAAKNNKRLVPVVCHAVEPADVNPTLAQLNWIFLPDDDGFAAAFQVLLKALDTDLVWVRAHTRLLTRAVEWDGKKRNAAYVLRGADLRDAEAWQARAFGKEPRPQPLPTPLQNDYIRASRQSATRQQRLVLSGVTVALVVAIVLALVAVYQANVATQERNVATSRELAASSVSQLPTDPQLSMLLAIQAEQVVSTSQAENALTKSIIASHVRTIIRGDKGGINSVAYDPSGRFILTSKGGRTEIVPSDDVTARIWEADTGKPVVSLAEPSGVVKSAVFSPDGDLVVTVSKEGTARIWKTTTGERVAELSGSTSASFSPDGKFVVTAGDNKTARIWQAPSGKLVAELSGSTDEVRSAGYSPDGKWIVTLGGPIARIWDVATRTTVRKISVGGGSNAVFSPNGQLILIENFGAPTIWQVTTGQRVAELDGHTTYVTSASFSPDGKSIVTTSNDGTALVWNTETWESGEPLRGHTSGVSGAVFSPKGNVLVTTGWDGLARVWNIGAPGFAAGAEVRLIGELRGHTNWVYGAAFSPDGQSIVTGSKDGTARVWRVPINPVYLSPDDPKAAELSKYVTEQFRDVVNSSPDSVWVSPSPDGRYKVSHYPNSNVPRVSDRATGNPVADLNGHTGYVVSAVFSPDSKLVVTASRDTTARVWDAATGKLIRVLSGKIEDLNSAAFSPDGSLIVTASRNGTVEVWETATGNPVFEVNAFISNDTDAAFSPDGQSILLAHHVNGSLERYACPVCVPVKDLLGLAQSLVNRQLSCEERQTYLHEQIECPTPTPTTVPAQVPALTPTTAPQAMDLVNATPTTAPQAMTLVNATTSAPVNTSTPHPSPTKARPTATPTAMRTITPTVFIPPGVYVTAIRVDPPNPKRGQPMRFYVSFLNTNSGPAGYRWRVRIYTPDNLRNSLGDTAALDESFPVGASEHASADNWRLGNGECIQLLARAIVVAPERDESEFPYLGNNRVEANFQACP